MTLLFYDTETTGLPDWHQPSEAPQQPHIVSLAAQLCDDEDMKPLAHLHLLVKPNGWEIPQEAIDAHGITTEFAARYGVDELEAVKMLLALAALADTRVGHNESFDARLVRIALKRNGMEEYAEDVWKPQESYCTARKSTKIVNLPPTDKMMAAGRKTPKTPTCAEAYEYFTKKPLEGTHTAWADMVACKTIYCAIKEHEAKG